MAYFVNPQDCNLKCFIANLPFVSKHIQLSRSINLLRCPIDLFGSISISVIESMEPIRGSICRSCRVRLSKQTKSHSFSTSSTRRVVPPESPHFVDVPSTYQPFLPWKPQPKGTLPVPRELFPASRPDKASEQYLKNTTPDKLEKNIVPQSKLTDIGKYKTRMAEVRKAQLREGLMGLHARKQAELKTMESRSRAKQIQRSALLSQAEREDARLTNVSTPSALHVSPATSLDALRAEVESAKQIHAQKVANYHNFTAAKQENKMDALHTLYMNARNFVTTEQQLDQLIRQQFDTSPPIDYASRQQFALGSSMSPLSQEASTPAKHADFMTNEGRGESMWNLGPPDSIKDMIRDATGESKDAPPFTSRGSAARLARGVTAANRRVAREQERFKRIAEKLSGGKI